jgi:hypothetical protein
MSMKKVKTTDEHSIYEKRSGRYAVQDKRKRWVHGDDKVAVLSAAGLVKQPEPKPAAAESAESAEATSEDAAEG